MAGWAQLSLFTCTFEFEKDSWRAPSFAPRLLGRGIPSVESEVAIAVRDEPGACTVVLTSCRSHLLHKAADSRTGLPRASYSDTILSRFVVTNVQRIVIGVKMPLTPHNKKG